MRLYHGSTIATKHPSLQKGRATTDFGKGFYTTTSFEQAKKWALLKQKREQSSNKLFDQLSFHNSKAISLLKFIEAI